MRAFIIISIWTFLHSTQGLWATPAAEFYSEGDYRTGSATLFNSVFARAFAPSGQNLVPFLQMGAQQTLGNNNYGDVYIAPGIHWREDFWGIFGEHRFHSTQNQGLSDHEWRALLVFGKRFSYPMTTYSRFVAFLEPYSELLFSSHENHHVFLQGFSRLGLGYQITSTTMTDVFVEPYLNFLRNRVGDSHLFELRPSIRTQTCFQQVCLSVSASRLISLEGLLDPGFRFLATIGGVI